MILIAVALFAALAFTFSRGAQQGGENITDHQSSLIATEFLDYAKQVERGVTRLLQNNCSENEISFQTPLTGGNVNPNAPGDKSCHVFDDAGAGLAWRKTPDSYWGQNLVYDSTYSKWSFTANFKVADVGDDKAELLMIFPALKKNICLAINDALGIDNPGGSPPDDEFSWDTLFDGTFNDAATSPDNAGDAAGTLLAGQRSGCAKTDTDVYVFYHTLHER